MQHSLISVRMFKDSCSPGPPEQEQLVFSQHSLRCRGSVMRCAGEAELLDAEQLHKLTSGATFAFPWPYMPVTAAKADAHRPVWVYFPCYSGSNWSRLCCHSSAATADMASAPKIVCAVRLRRQPLAEWSKDTTASISSAVTGCAVMIVAAVFLGLRSCLMNRRLG